MKAGHQLLVSQGILIKLLLLIAFSETARVILKSFASPYQHWKKKEKH